jgi:hypothetical protein
MKTHVSVSNLTSIMIYIDYLAVLKDVNTQAAEQTFSWLKNYAHMISSMGWKRTPLFIMTLFHLKNMAAVNRPPSSVFDVVRIANTNQCVNRCLIFKAPNVPDVTGVSLCHLAEDLQLQLASSTPCSDKSVEEASSQLTSDHANLPRGQTDWDAKMEEILAKRRRSASHRR